MWSLQSCGSLSHPLSKGLFHLNDRQIAGNKLELQRLTCRCRANNMAIWRDDVDAVMTEELAHPLRQVFSNPGLVVSPQIDDRIVPCG